jgi:hypothetical protein
MTSNGAPAGSTGPGEIDTTKSRPTYLSYAKGPSGLV